MNVIDLFTRTTGFPAKLSNPEFLQSVAELFEILKDYVRERYQLDNEITASVSFHYINSIGLYSQTVKKDELIGIVFGANTDLLIDWSSFLFEHKDSEHYRLDSHVVISKIAMQEALLSGNIRQSFVLGSHINNILKEYNNKGFQTLSFLKIIGVRVTFICYVIALLKN